MPYRDDPGVPDLSQALGMAAGLFSSENKHLIFAKLLNHIRRMLWSLYTII